MNVAKNVFKTVVLTVAVAAGLFLFGSSQQAQAGDSEGETQEQFIFLPLVSNNYINLPDPNTAVPLTLPYECHNEYDAYINADQCAIETGKWYTLTITQLDDLPRYTVTFPVTEGNGLTIKMVYDENRGNPFVYLPSRVYAPSTFDQCSGYNAPYYFTEAETEYYVPMPDLGEGSIYLESGTYCFAMPDDINNETLEVTFAIFEGDVTSP